MVTLSCGAEARTLARHPHSHHYFLSQETPEGDDTIPFLTNSSRFEALIGQIMLRLLVPLALLDY